MGARLLGRWSSSTEGLGKITEGKCPSSPDFLFILQWQITSSAHSKEQRQNGRTSPRFAAFGCPVHRRKWLHMTCASNDIKHVCTWATERGVECPKVVMTWAGTVYCNYGLQWLVTGVMRQDVRLSQYPESHSNLTQGQEPQQEEEQRTYTPNRSRRGLISKRIIPRGAACPQVLSLHFPKRSELCFQVPPQAVFLIPIYR